MSRSRRSSVIAISLLLGAESLAFARVPEPAAPDAWWSKVQANLSASQYRITPRSVLAIDGTGAPCEVAWQATNRAQNLRFSFTRESFRAQPRDVNPAESSAWTWGLSLTGSGRAGAMTRVEPTVPEVAGNQVSYRRGDLVEWYVNDARGLEQGFTIERSPAPAAAGGMVRLEFEITGSLTAIRNDAGTAIDFLAPGDVRAIRFADLHVTDALWRVLPASFEVDGSRLAILVDDRGATYPITIDPLASNPAWTAQGNQIQANLGYWVASAGDVNGDGFDDVIVGAPFYDNGELDEGRAFVFHGSAAGLSASANWTAESNQALAHFGSCVAAAGDVNSDGFGDVIVGAPVYDNGQSDEGRAYIYLGSASGLAAVANWTAESNQTSSFFGVSVAPAGDVNGDGYGDVIVGARNFDNGQPDEGRALAYYGSVSGANSVAGWTAEANSPGSQFGVAVSTAGDVNGDGYDDVIVGAATYGNGQTSEGRAFVYSGTLVGLKPNAIWTAESNQTMAFFGNSVGNAGDVNGDGFGDVIVGCYFYDNGQTDEGRAFTYHGSAAGPSVAANRIVESEQPFANTGTSVAAAGDVNADGYGDVIVGAFAYDNGQSNEGRAFVYDGSGAGLSVTANWMAESNQAGAFFGASVASAGDVNGDG